MSSSQIANITYVKAKNGQDTCLINNKPLHSLYNPENESRQFVEAQIKNIDYKPSNIIITGIAYSYCNSYIKETFPNCKISCIQYSKQIKTQNNFDKIFYVSDILAEELFLFLSEEHYTDTLFISWKPSETLFPNEYVIVWQSIKEYISKSSQIITTRIFFSHRWIYNSINLFLNQKKVMNLPKTKLPVLLICSGVTLKESIPYIKEYKNSFFILSVSSAITVLLKNNITPDLCISTDGGFYAKKHLSELHKFNLLQQKKIPIAISSESMIPSFLFLSTPIVNLQYSDEESEKPRYLLNNGYIVRRNGTVGGTAYDIARLITDNNIFAIGLDLTFSKGYQHTQPNELELNESCNDNRLLTLEKRQSIKQFSSGSLETYAKWFESQAPEFFHNFFRLKTSKQKFLRKLNNVKDKNWEDLLQNINTEKNNAIFFQHQNNYKQETNLVDSIQHVIKDIFSNSITKETEYWTKTICLYEFLQNKKYNTIETNEKMKKKAIDFLEDLLIYINRRNNYNE